jgi:hypothetical protein
MTGTYREHLAVLPINPCVPRRILVTAQPTSEGGAGRGPMLSFLATLDEDYHETTGTPSSRTGQDEVARASNLWTRPMPSDPRFSAGPSSLLFTIWTEHCCILNFVK